MILEHNLSVNHFKRVVSLKELRAVSLKYDSIDAIGINRYFGFFEFKDQKYLHINCPSYMIRDTPISNEFVFLSLLFLSLYLFYSYLLYSFLALLS